MINECLRCAVFALLAAVVVSVAGQSSEERALNTTGLWSKYNLIVKPTAPNGVAVTTPPGDQDARYKSPLKTKYNHKTDKPDFDRPYLSNHNMGVESGSEELEPYSQEVVDDEEAEDDGDDDAEEEEEEETQSSEEQDEAHHSTTQRSQAIHHKAPVKVAVVEISTAKSAEKKYNKLNKIKKGTKPTASTTIHHHHHHEDDEDASTVHQKGHKTKGGKKYKIKGLKKLRKYMLPLLLAYKLKFFTLVPLLLGGLVLIVASTGFAGFFFALFAVGVGLKKD